MKIEEIYSDYNLKDKNIYEDVIALAKNTGVFEELQFELMDFLKLYEITFKTQYATRRMILVILLTYIRNYECPVDIVQVYHPFKKGMGKIKQMIYKLERQMELKYSIYHHTKVICNRIEYDLGLENDIKVETPNNHTSALYRYVLSQLVESGTIDRNVAEKYAETKYPRTIRGGL